MEIANYGKFLWFFLSCPSDIKNIIKGQWYSQYPQAEMEEIKDYSEKLFTKYFSKGIAGSELYYDQSDFIPVKTFHDLQKNPLVSLAGIINSFSNDEMGIIQLVLQPQKKENIWNKLLKRRREEIRTKVCYGQEEKPEYIQLEEGKEESSSLKATIRFVMFAKDKDKALLNLSTVLAIYKKGLERPKLQKFKEDIRADNRFFE